MNQSIKLLAVCIIGLLINSDIAFAQVNKNSELFKTLKSNDSILFKVGFNKCEIEKSAKLMFDDLEFYHDKSGITNSKAEFISVMKNGLCKPNNTEKPYRFLVEGSLEVFPLYNNDTLYGALQNGKHFFSPDKTMTYEKSNNYALFSHLWILENNVWKIKRVISYNHVSKEVVQSIEEVTVSKELLVKYSGNYKAQYSGDVIIKLENNKLFIKAEGLETKLTAIAKNKFAHPKAPLVFEFILDKNGETREMIVNENGKMVEKATKQ